MELIGRIGGLWRYPVKSLGGEALQHAVLDETGIIGDRRWALKNRRTGELVNCKVFTSLLTMAAAYSDEPEPGFGVVHADIVLPDGRRLRTSDPSVNGAISAIAGQPLELWPLLPPSCVDHYRLRNRFTPELTKQRMGLKPDDPYPDFSTYEPEMLEELQHFFSPRGSYKDAYPLHYVTSRSLETLAGHRPGLDVNPRRFRPNFYIEDVAGSGFPELGWTGFDLVIGSAVLSCGEETVRCVMPSQAQVGLKAEPHMGFVLNRVTKLKFGAYCHIRQAGTISVGDEVFLERRPKQHAIRASLPPLPDDIVRGEERTPPPLTPFYPARVVRKQRETADTVSFGFKMQDAPAFPFLPGQHLIFRLSPADHARPIMRSYSLCSAPGVSTADSGAAEDYAITVKRIGTGSVYLHDAVNVGDVLDVRWPSGRFFAVPEASAPIALVSNGIGITPLFSMLQAIAMRNPAREVFWLHATANSSTQVFRAETAQLARQLANFHRRIIYRRPTAADMPGVDYDATARLSAEDFAAFARRPDIELFICGSESFTASAQAIARGLGIPDGRIQTEKFFSTLRKTPAGNGRPAQKHAVHFARSGVEAEWSEGDETLLEIAEQAGIPADYGCRFGACLACATRIVKGEVKYPNAEVESKPGEALICCAEPVSELVLDL